MKRKKVMTQEEKEQEELEKVNQSIEQLEKERIEKKRIPKDEEAKINKKLFENILIADILMVFFYLISLGSLNIETPVFLTDLKVFSISLIIFTIILFEVSYKKESGNLCIHGIESLILSIVMLFSSYVYTIQMKEFTTFAAIVSYAFAIYYVGKSIVIYKKMKKKYIAGLSDIDEIIKK